MRGINFLAGLGTILIFIGIFSFRAAFERRNFKEKMKKAPVRSYGKAFLLFIGVVCFILGVLSIIKSLKLI